MSSNQHLVIRESEPDSYEYALGGVSSEKFIDSICVFECNGYKGIKATKRIEKGTIVFMSTPYITYNFYDPCKLLPFKRLLLATTQIFNLGKNIKFDWVSDLLPREGPIEDFDMENLKRHVTANRHIIPIEEEEQFIQLFCKIKRNCAFVGKRLEVFHSWSFFNHSCTPNAVSVFSEDGVFVRAVKNINRKEEICINYIPGFEGDKRMYLYDLLQADCKCDSCKK